MYLEFVVKSHIPASFIHYLHSYKVQYLFFLFGKIHYSKFKKIELARFEYSTCKKKLNYLKIEYVLYYINLKQIKKRKRINDFIYCL